MFLACLPHTTPGISKKKQFAIPTIRSKILVNSLIFFLNPNGQCAGFQTGRTPNGRLTWRSDARRQAQRLLKTCWTASLVCLPNQPGYQLHSRAHEKLRARII